MDTNVTELVHKDLAYQVIGACFEVYNELGFGFLEAVYQESLAIEFAERGIRFAAQPEIAIHYKGRELGHFYKPDFIVEDRIVLEIKALVALTGEHDAQVINYLKATGLRLGILANFGRPGGLDHKRLLFG